MAPTRPTGWSDNLVTRGRPDAADHLRHPGRRDHAPPASPSALSQQHTGSVVPIWGGGPGGAEILGTTDHTDLFEVLGGEDRRRP